MAAPGDQAKNTRGKIEFAVSVGLVFVSDSITKSEIRSDPPIVLEINAKSVCETPLFRISLIDIELRGAATNRRIQSFNDAPHHSKLVGGGGDSLLLQQHGTAITSRLLSTTFARDWIVGTIELRPAAGKPQLPAKLVGLVSSFDAPRIRPPNLNMCTPFESE
jgi:hypothetical protein